MIRLLIYVFSLMVLIHACKEDHKVHESNDTVINWNAAADSSSENLYIKFWNAGEKCFNYHSTGYLDFQYWPQAHGLDVLVDAYNRSGENIYKHPIDLWYDGVWKNNGNTFYNVFYDDMEWNALAMLRAYNALGDEKFKTASIDLWNDIKTGWNDNASGGIAWKKGQLWSKNACSNGPACILATRLYQQFGDESDKQWALDIYNWEKANLFNPANGAVYDNIDSRTNTVNTSWIFTYNQGTFLGSALELYKITGEKSYLNDAIKAADYTLNSLVNSGDQILKTEGTGDGGLFKGVFVRYFTQLILLPDLDESVRKRYIQFLVYNAKALWSQGTNKSDLLYAPYWKDKPNGQTTLSVQLSGCMLIEAAALLEKNDKL